MTTRKRQEDTRWLAGWKDHPKTENTALDPYDEAGTMHESLTTLTQLGFIVRISGCVGNYSVQCIAIRDTPYRLKEPIGMSYAGADLRLVLASAAYEADLLTTGGQAAEWRVGERARWVQS
jgi:hypothetical protein